MMITPQVDLFVIRGVCVHELRQSIRTEMSNTGSGSKGAFVDIELYLRRSWFSDNSAHLHHK